MSQPAANMQKAMEAMEKAQTTETRQIVIVPTYSMRFIIFMSVAAMMMITLFPVLVIRLAVVSSELNPFYSTQTHGAANVAVNVTDVPAWTQQDGDATALSQRVEVTQLTQSSSKVGSSEVPTTTSSISGKDEKTAVPSRVDLEVPSESLRAQRGRLGAARKSLHKKSLESSTVSP